MSESYKKLIETLMSKIITQLKASSTWLKRTLEESTGKKILNQASYSFSTNRQA